MRAFDFKPCLVLWGIMFLGCSLEEPSQAAFEIPLVAVNLPQPKDFQTLINRCDSIMCAIDKRSHLPPQPQVLPELPTQMPEPLQGKHIMQLFKHIRMEDGYHLHCLTYGPSSKTIGLLIASKDPEPKNHPLNVPFLIASPDDPHAPHTSVNPLHHVIADGTDEGYIELSILEHYRHNHWLLDNYLTQAEVIENLIDSVVKESNPPYSKEHKVVETNSSNPILHFGMEASSAYMDSTELNKAIAYLQSVAAPKIVERSDHHVVVRHVEYSLLCFDRYFRILWTEISKDPPYHFRTIKSENTLEFGTIMLCD